MPAPALAREGAGMSARRVPAGARKLEDHCRTMLSRHHGYVREHHEDMPEVRDWTWSTD